MRRGLAWVGTMLFAVTTVIAQTALSDWNRVIAIPPGHRIEARTHTRERIHGTLVGADESGLVVLVKGSERQLLKTAVRSIDELTAQTPDSSRDGTLLGAAIGAGYGAWVALKIEGSDDARTRTRLTPLTTAGIGALIGFMIDSATHRDGRRRVYDASER